MGRVLSEERKKGNRLRGKILERDGYKCRICGSSENLEVHHMQALVYHGKSKEENLVTLCEECHVFAPEKSIEENEKYLKERNKDIYDRMMQEPNVAAMVSVAYVEFLKERIGEYVKLGFIDQQQANFIMMFETSKVF